MLIDLFKESKLILSSNKELALLKTRNCDILEDLSYYQREVAASLDTDFHVQSVLDNKDSKRAYQELFGKISDSHNEIEKLGVCKYAKAYTTIISLEDSLDYILHRLSGAKVDNIRKIPAYDVLSRSLLKLNFRGLEGFTTDSFLDIDSNLDKFLTDLESKILEDSENRQKDFMLALIRSIILEVSGVVEYLSFYYNSMMDKGTSVIRSKSFCSFVLTTMKKCDDIILIKSNGFEDYEVKVRSFEKKEYLHGIDLKYSK